MRNLLFGMLSFALVAGCLIAADQPAQATPAPVSSVPANPAAGNPAPPNPAPKPWWRSGRWRMPQPNPKAALLPRISVKGNHFVNPAGETVLFRGVAIADPDKLAGQGHWGPELFAAVKDMGPIW